MNAKQQLPPKLIALAVAVIVSASASAAKGPSMPFSKGVTWVYEGTVAWQEGAEVKSRRLSIKSEILEVFSYPRANVAVVRGFPSELAWFGDKRHPRYSLLILGSEGLLELEVDGEREARRLARDLTGLSRELRRRGDEVMPFPLSGGGPFLSPVKGFHPSKAPMSYRGVYRTNPDRTAVDFVPGLGVVRYVYEHHGTVSSVDVVLKEIRFRGRRAGKR